VGKFGQNCRALNRLAQKKKAAASIVSTNTMDWTTHHLFYYGVHLPVLVLQVYSYVHQNGLHVPVEPFRFLLPSKLAWIFGLSASWPATIKCRRPPACRGLLENPRRGIESAFIDASETCMGLAGVCELMTVIRRSLGQRFWVCFCSRTHTHMLPS
jgi:hypothetical protein